MPDYAKFRDHESKMRLFKILRLWLDYVKQKKYRHDQMLKQEEELKLCAYVQNIAKIGNLGQVPSDGTDKYCVFVDSF